MSNARWKIDCGSADLHDAVGTKSTKRVFYGSLEMFE